ncbi:restriction endonuclease subunit S [Collinsella sp. zg1085]|uniref:restriction endonuclease subunit S n=1 Tax=Collinsella sp. zg1085 TaxID=2844380 RepID=UPI001C0E5CDC|nr:restriction endonuclease subunit S [Collinsella sp. zg1085]QWT17336.1 restriction endonuclease subunit S [Collinsella sp. zg1085]
MQSLNEREWRQLSAFGNGAPLHIETTSSSIDGIRLIDDGEKSVPYITRSDANNGLARFVSAKNYAFGSDDGGCITVGLDTQTAFYQPHKFVTGQNVQVITDKNLNKDVAQFVVPILRQQMTAKFNWGGNGATLGRMRRLSIMLPVDDDGNPDYDYMTQYASEMRGGVAHAV